MLTCMSFVDLSMHAPFTVSRIELCLLIKLHMDCNFNPPPPLRTTVLAVGLLSSSFSVNENDGSLRVGVVIHSGHFVSEPSVLISTQAGTATPGTWVLALNTA